MGHCDFIFSRPLEKKTEEAKCNNLMLGLAKKDDKYSQSGH